MVADFQRSQEYQDVLLATYNNGLEEYGPNVKATEVLKEVKRHLGEDSTEATEEDQKAEEEDTSSWGQKDQAEQESHDDPTLQA